MNVTANISRRKTYLNQVGTRPTMESYLLAMEPYILAIAARSAAAVSLDSQEDLEQEARMTLVSVFQANTKKKKPIELYKIGTRAIFNHIRDLYEHSTSVARGGMGTHEIRRKRVTPGHYQPVQIVSGDDVLDQKQGETRMTTLFDTVESDEGSPLDRLLVREVMDKILASATQVERRTLRASMLPRALDTTESRALFRTLRSKISRQIRLSK